MAHILLTLEHGSSQHPDYQALHEWLETHEIDPMWVCLPQSVLVTSTDIVLKEYVHTTDGKIAVAKKEAVRRTARYPRRGRPMPRLTNTEVS